MDDCHLGLNGLPRKYVGLDGEGCDDSFDGSFDGSFEGEYDLTDSATLDHFKYNPVTDKLEADKPIETTLSSLYLGEQHRMSSGGENVFFTNESSQINWYPMWGGLKDMNVAENKSDAGIIKPSARNYSSFSIIEINGAVDTGVTDAINQAVIPFAVSGVGADMVIEDTIIPSDTLYYNIYYGTDGDSYANQAFESKKRGLTLNAGDSFEWIYEHPVETKAGQAIYARIDVESADGTTRPLQVRKAVNGGMYVTVQAFLFTDDDIALKSDIEGIVSGSNYKGAYDAATDTPTLTLSGSEVNGDFFRVSVSGGAYEVGDLIIFNGTTTSYDHIPVKSLTQSLLETSPLKIYDTYVKANFTSAIKDGSALYPYSEIQTAVDAASDGDSIFLDGEFNIAIEIVLPSDKSLTFVGANNTTIQYASYNTSNGDVMSFDGDSSKTLIFKDITFKNAGGYGLLIKNTDKVELRKCKFFNNGWDGTQLHTAASKTLTGLLGYDSTQAELQSFYAGSHASNGGALRLENCRVPLVRECRAENNLRGLRIQDCGINGGGFVIENQSLNNIESGIYIAAGALGGCQNITVTINYSSYNANNGLLCIGGINNKFSQNEVNGNWNAGFCAWGAANSTLRDCGLYDNNRSTYNGIGNTGDAKASIQINEAYNLLGTQISLNPAFRFIAEILDTQVHYTGLGSNADKVGFLITSGVGALPDNEKNIIKIDDVGFIGQDYAIDLSEVDVTNLRLSLGDNSYQSIGQKAVKAPLAGNYSELPFSNHVMQVPSVDVVVDTLKQTIALHEGVGGNVINVYSMNELQSVLKSNSVDIIQKSSDKIQLRDLTFGNIYINGVVAGNNLNSANNSLNAAFNMDLTQYKDFLVSEVGINGDESSGGSLPAIANNWYISYGSQAGTQINQATIGNNYRNFNPFYNGEALEKGHEFIWTLNPSISFMIGLWGAAEGNYDGSDAIQPSNWTVGFGFQATNTRFSTPDSSGVTIEQGGDFAGMYGIPNGQVAVRFGQDGYLYLFEVVGGGYTLIGKSNSTVSGTSVMIQWASFNEGSFPVMTERTETWEIVHDFDNSENGEWSDGIEDGTILKSRMTVSPNQKVVLDLNHFGRGEHIGFGYTGASSGVANAENQIDDHFFYNQSELLKGDANNGGSWTFNTEATGYYNPIGDGSNIGYTMGNGVNLGEIAIRYTNGNAIKLFHETNNELIATLNATKDGSPLNIYFGAAENNHPANRIPILGKFDLADNDNPASAISEWWYIESPDGTFFYPLFKTEAEANAIDIKEGGSGTSHTHTFLDDPTNTTWYMNDTNSTHVGTQAPQGGVYGSSTNVVWNEQETGADSNYAPTFTDLTFTVAEQSAANLVYKPAGDTATYNVTGVPTGYADTGYAIVGTAETITDGIDIVHTLNVTKANAFGSDTGTITFTVTDDPSNNVSANSTPWTKALDFSGSNEYAKMVSSSSLENAIRMGNASDLVAANSDSSKTSDNYFAKPWATAIVFQTPNNTGNQHIWNSGEGAGTGDDNIYLRMQGSNGALYFGWGREGSGYNEYLIANIGGSYNQSTGQWWGIYIAHKGQRFNSSNATAANLVDAFDIRLMGTNDVTPVFDTLYDIGSTASNWTSTGARMDRSVAGDFTIAGRSANRSFHGKVASMVITTLRQNVTMPTDAEIKLMITDPIKWMNDYKIGNAFRRPHSAFEETFSQSSYSSSDATQIWLMGDGTLDSYSNSIRNQVRPADQNYTKLQLNNMQSNDIVNVNINGLS